MYFFFVLFFFLSLFCFFFFFFFNDTATTEIYTLSLHDALPITSPLTVRRNSVTSSGRSSTSSTIRCVSGDRKSTRLNSSHVAISYAVFCLKKKKKPKYTQNINENKKNKNKIKQ